MTITHPTVDCWKIENAPSLDTIHVFWMDVAPGQGYVTVICYGQAWSAYFGAMGGAEGRGIKEFFAACDTSYMINKMFAPHLKQSKERDAYLGRIINAVRFAVEATA